LDWKSPWCGPEYCGQRVSERRWLAADAYKWEQPGELINVIVDDFLFEDFLQEFVPTFSDEQRTAAFEFWDELNGFCNTTPRSLDSAEVLADPRWDAVRHKSAAFVTAFKDRWPPSEPPLDSN
jgi:hypothetical protein